MIRGLLADRFKLVMRVDQKRMPVYALVIASGGSKLQKSAIAEKDCIATVPVYTVAHIERPAGE